jgi:3'-phosphoadenosine 5'-phosphosulfate sulfotransferase (PAPS reductase)/FAD synthetase
MQTVEELQRLQKLPLEQKIVMTKQRIMQWVEHYGEDRVAISFSGGKDSTVLIHIARQLYPNLKACFIDVPTQYPELRTFSEKFDNVDIVKPRISFMQVCDQYGFPLISKEVSECVSGARKYLTKVLEEMNAPDRQTDSTRISIGTTEYVELASMQNPSAVGTTTILENSEELANILNDRMLNRKGGSNQRVAIMLGMLTNDQKIQANIPSENRSKFSQEKYKFFLDAPFEISNMCCNVMKKYPAHDYTKKTGRLFITAQMAEESRIRMQKWVQNGCNGFEMKHPISNPMSFWTEKDVLEYIVKYGIEICSVYGDIVEDYGDQVDGQMCLADFGIGEKQCQYKCTGCKRTGCMLCGFGAHFDKPGEGRFERLKETHPGMYGLLDKVQNNGVTFREAIEWTNEHGNLNIRLGD